MYLWSHIHIHVVNEMKWNLNENKSLDSQSSSKSVSIGSIQFSTWPLRSKTVKQMMCKHLWRAATDSPEPIFISSPGPKVQLNYCHHLASVVCCLLSVVCKLFTFQASSPKPKPIGTKLSRNVPWMVLYKVTVFRSSRIFNMAARANNMLWLAEISKIFFSETNELTEPKL